MNQQIIRALATYSDAVSALARAGVAEGNARNLEGKGIAVGGRDAVITEIMEGADGVTVAYDTTDTIKKESKWCYPAQITEIFEVCEDCKRRKTDCSCTESEPEEDESLTDSERNGMMKGQQWR